LQGESTDKDMNKHNKSTPSSKQVQDWKYLLLVVIITFVVMSPTLQNEFVNWDDEVYITKNEVIKQIPFSNLVEIFTYKINNFSVPLTLLSFQIEHYFFGLNPFPYHLTNLLLHLINVILIYLFINQLIDNQQNKKYLKRFQIAFFVALLFGIHPMNVESVAWATERKDLLYTFFTLWALFHYQNMPHSPTPYQLVQNKRYWLSLLFFVLSLLAKPQAIFFPMLLLLVDYFKDKPLKINLVIQKLPFFLVSLMTGIYLLTNVGTKVYEKLPDLTFFEKCLFSSYQVCLYLLKFFFPFNLNNFYGYPLLENGFYPIIFYVTPLILLGLIILIYWKCRANKLVIFGMSFYFANIFIFLQVFSVNTAIAYERFNYFAYNGLFLILVVYLHKTKLHEYFRYALFAYLVLLGFLSFQRCKVWQSNITLFADMAQKNPNDDNANKIALKNMGDALMEKRDFAAAIEKYTQSLGRDTNYEQAYLGRGYAYFNLKRFVEALADYNKALTLELSFQNKQDAFFNRGTSLMNLKNYAQAIGDFNAVIQANPNSISAYLNRAYSLIGLGEYALAKADYQRVLQIDAGNAIAISQLQILQKQEKN
jgi:tetratricopeptide (TPR) repeat protein